MAAHTSNKAATSLVDYTISLVESPGTGLSSSFGGIASLLIAGSILIIYHSPETQKILSKIKTRLAAQAPSKIITTPPTDASSTSSSQTTQTVADLYTELKATQSSLQTTRAELSERQFAILSTQAKLSSAEIELSSTQQELLSSRTRTAALESELHTARATIADLEATRVQLCAARTQISALEAELEGERKDPEEAEPLQEKELNAEYSRGYDDGFEDGFTATTPLSPRSPKLDLPPTNASIASTIERRKKIPRIGKAGWFDAL